MHDCTDTSPEAKPGEKEPWLLRKTRYIDSLTSKAYRGLISEGVTASEWAETYPQRNRLGDAPPGSAPNGCGPGGNSSPCGG